MLAATCSCEMHASDVQTFLPAHDYDLAATLTSGQAFRWRQGPGGWEGIIHGRWVRLRQCKDGIVAQTATAQRDWSWLTDYLQTSLDLNSVLLTFPDDEPMRASMSAC